MQHDERRKQLATIDEQIAKVGQQFRGHLMYIELMARLQNRTLEEMADADLYTLAESLETLRTVRKRLLVAYMNDRGMLDCAPAVGQTPPGMVTSKSSNDRRLSGR